MYTFETNIRFSEVDEGGRLSIPAIIDLLQDCSTFQSDSLGVGPAHAAATGRAWMISAWEVEVLSRPRFNDPVSVSTWATDFKGIKATRDFTICATADDRPLVRAASSWFLFDSSEGRPIRLPEEETAPYSADLEDEPLGLPRIPRRLKLEGEPVSAAPVTVTGAHLDTNHHVNNAQYVSLALGALEELALSAPGADGTAQAGEDAPFWMDVHYTAAAKLGDVLHPHIYRAEDAVTVSLDNDGGKPFAQVRLHR